MTTTYYALPSANGAGPAGPDVEDLMPKARRLAAVAGRIPSKRSLKRDLKVGWPKVDLVHARLIAEDPDAPRSPLGPKPATFQHPISPLTPSFEPVRPATDWTRRADIPIPEADLDADLARLVRRTSLMRQGFYCVVLLVALAGQVSGAVETLHIPMIAAIPAVAALELGGVVVLANADVRRRLGERAIASRALSAAIAAAAVTFNWLAHVDHLLGGFFAGMSALGYLVWLMHTENQRRDRLRVKGDLPPTTPAYELAGHWLRHPWLTMRARALAKADPRFGLYDSLATARAEVRRERREAAIAKVLHKKIKSAVDPKTADIAIAVYDLDEIAARLAQRADYDGLTALIAADLTPERIAPTAQADEQRAARRA